MDGTEAQINFDAPAVLRKWPSLANQRTEDATPYLLVDGTLYECLRKLPRPLQENRLVPCSRPVAAPAQGELSALEIRDARAGERVERSGQRRPSWTF
jgi:hypothetical protein